MDRTTSTVAVPLLLAAFGPKVIRFVTNAIRKTEAERKQAVNDVAPLLPWPDGIGAVWLLARTAWGDEATIGNESPRGPGFGSRIVFGLVFNTFAVTLYDCKKAIHSADKLPPIPSIPQ